MKVQKQVNTKKLVKEFITEKTGVQVDEHETVAIHSIPCAPGKPRPILVKVVCLQTKTKIMTKRSVIKILGSGQNVTKANMELMAELTERPDIEAAWYFCQDKKLDSTLQMT
jgi:hypothetical protein